VFGLVQLIPSTLVTEVTLRSGCDFIVLDCEHGSLDESAVLASLQVISGTHAFTLVRVRSRDFSAIARYLEYGAHGILMPHVRTAVEARAFVESARQAPERWNSARPLLLAMIEEGEAVSNIEAISATEGVSGLVIGPRDLAHDLGVVEDFSIPRFQSAFVEIEGAARRKGLLLGSRVPSGCSMERLVSAGHVLLLAGNDLAALSEGYRLRLDAIRDMRS
jgi:2-keto-3-deoxy-L-rhamnonate aldolase RhmA